MTPGLLSSAFYFVPRLLRTELYSEKLGMVTVISWNFALVGVVISLALGYTQAREYAELIWPMDMLLVVALCSRFLQSDHDRQAAPRADSVCFRLVCLRAVILTAATYFLGNVIWKPDTGALLGIPDAILLWFYGHNIFGLLLPRCRWRWPTM